jgi:hypothetical protein
MDKLSQYFQTRDSSLHALDQYLLFAAGRQWDIGGPTGKLRLYRLGRDAFADDATQPSGPAAFRDAYEMIRAWPGVQRGGSLAPASRAFEAIRSTGSQFLYGSGVSLATLTFPSPEADALEAFLPELKFLKPAQSYPWMAVSKVLHFVNPSLFPIWDTEVMWNGVMRGAFSAEYKAFCLKNAFRAYENGTVFLRNYWLWAAHYIQRADSDFMAWFADWMRKNYSRDLEKYGMSDSVTSLHATAFELVAIGASQVG